MNARQLKFHSRQEIPALELDFSISHKSRISDYVWDFSDGRLERLNSVSNSKLKIDWRSLEQFANSTSIISLKLLIALKVNGISAFRLRRNLKPNTICLTARNLIELFICISKYLAVQSGLEKVVIDIFNLEAIDIQKGLDNYQRESISGLRPLLSLLSNETFQNELQRLTNGYKAFRFTETDIRKLHFPLREVNARKTFKAIPLQDDLLLFLVKSSTSDVQLFLKRLGITLIIDSGLSEHSTLPIPSSIDLKECFEDYKKIRLTGIAHMEKNGKRGSNEFNERALFRERHGISPLDFKHWVERVQSAAMYLVLQFTGARYSEAISFKTGSIEQKGGEYYVKGTLVKGKTEALRHTNDYWVAIPIVQDAVKILELITTYTLHDYLFASNHARILNIKHVPLSLGRLNDRLNEYLYDIDSAGKYSDRTNDPLADRNKRIRPEYRISTHRIRHTLANQFYRHRSGLLVAAYHFKHAYIAIKMYKIPNEVTEGYGNIGNEIFKNAQQQDFKEEIIYSICHPEAQIAGGGAKRFLKNREEFYTAEIKKGKSVETILRDLSKRNLPFADVMLGFCGGKDNYSDDDGRLKSPPCVGQCKCNPNDCGNAIIPAIKKPYWEAMKENNINLLADPRMAHAKDFLKFHIAEADKVLKVLGNGNP